MTSGQAGGPGMKGERGSVIYENQNVVAESGDRGPKGFSGNVGDAGLPGYFTKPYYILAIFCIFCYLNHCSVITVSCTI